MRLTGGLVFAVALLAVTLYFVTAGLEFDEMARQVPMIVGIPIAALLVLQIATELFPRVFARLDRADRKQVVQIDEELIAQAEATLASDENPGRSLEVHAWVGAFVLVIYAVGFLTAIPVFLTSLLYFRLKEKLWVTLLAAAAMWVVAYLGFMKLMEVPLFSGVIWG